MIFSNFNLALPGKKVSETNFHRELGLVTWGEQKKKKVKCKLCGLEMIHSHN